MTQQTQIVSRHRWLDVVRALGAFMVVMIHITYLGPRLSVTGHFYYGLTRVAVPLFFMASGYLLLGRVEPLADFFRKRLSKVLIPLIVWSLIYMIWREEGFGKPLPDIVKAYILRMLNKPTENHLWFLYALLGLYLFTPILRLYLLKADEKDLLYFLGIWFVFIPIDLFIRAFTPIQIALQYQFLGGYVGYFLFGYYAGRKEWTPRAKRIAWILFFAGLAATTLGMWYREIYHVQNQYFEEYLSANVVVMSWALYVLMKDMIISDALYKFITPFSNASFGIYLIHIIVITELFERSPLSALTQAGWGIYMTPILGIIGFLASFGIVFILQKIPVIRSIVP